MPQLSQVFTVSGLSLYFPVLELWVAQSVLLPICSSWFICTPMWDHLLHQLPHCHESSPAWLPISAPPISLDECFFFISLVVRLSYGLIFCQFWLVFVLKLLLSSFWLCDEAQCVYLRLHLGWYLIFIF